MGLVERAAALARRLLPERMLEGVDRRLLSTGILLSAEEYVGICLLLSLVGGAVAGVLGLLLL